MSYSYHHSGDVHKWDYSTSSWVTCYYYDCFGHTRSTATSLEQKLVGIKPELVTNQWSTSLLVSGLVLASLTAIGMAASKCKKQKGMISNDLNDGLLSVN